MLHMNWFKYLNLNGDNIQFSNTYYWDKIVREKKFLCEDLEIIKNYY